MNLPDIFATCGALISMLSNIPQVWKVRKMYTTSDLHSWSIIMHFVAASLWSTYGFMLNLNILGMESGIVAILNLTILAAIIRDRGIYNRPLSRNDKEYIQNSSPQTVSALCGTQHPDLNT
jgi:uncharacterized protein with PQ loop repeat